MRNDFHVPGFPLPGGKVRQARTICSFAPSAGHIFADVFCGLGNIFWPAPSLLNYRHWWLNDIRTSGFFAAIARIGNTVIVPNREATSDFYQFYKAQCQRLYRSTYSDEGKVLEPYLTRNGAGFFAVGARTSGGGPGAEAYAQNLREAYRIMHAVHPRITGWDYERVLECLGPNDFAVIDAPYIGASVGPYSASDLDHKRLIIWLKYAKFPWLLCEYRHPIYVKAFGEPFWTQEVHRFAHQNGGRRTECMWKNY
jgi:site-specific DNA-adenine methylase